MLTRRSDAIGRKWKRGLLAAIIVVEVVLATMMVRPPWGSPSWLWAFALVVYMPFVLVGAAILKFFVLQAQRARR